MHTVMAACIILHNMIVEDEWHDHTLTHDFMFGSDHCFEVAPPPFLREDISIEELSSNMERMQDRQCHYRLRDDLINHIWNSHGEEE